MAFLLNWIVEKRRVLVPILTWHDLLHIITLLMFSGVWMVGKQEAI